MTTVQIKAKMLTPLTPNFIRLSNGSSVSIADLSEKCLKQIGKDWTIKLIENANKKRK